MARHKLVIPHPTLVKDAKSGIWHVSYTHPEKGYTVKKSTGERNRAAAAQAMHAMAAEIVGISPSGDDYSIGELLKAYEAREDEVADAERYALPRLMEFFGKYKPDQLVDGAWRRYRKWRIGHDHVNAPALRKIEKNQEVRKVSDSTACRELTVMRAAISWAKRNPKWKGLGHVRVVLPDAQQNARIQYLSKAEVRRLVEACVEPHTGLFVLLALATAGRHAALLDLKWSAVKWPTGGVTPTDSEVLPTTFKIVEVRRGQKPTPENTLTGLTGAGTRYATWNKDKLSGPIHLDLGTATGNKRKPIGVISPTNVRLYTALFDAYQRRTTEFVIEYRGRKVDRVDLSEAYRRAGIKRPEAPQHVLKHTAISWMVQDGAELARIAALSRTSVRTIERVYGHLSPKHIEVVGDVLTVE